MEEYYKIHYLDQFSSDKKYGESWDRQADQGIKTVFLVASTSSAESISTTLPIRLGCFGGEHLEGRGTPLHVVVSGCSKLLRRCGFCGGAAEAQDRG